MFMRTYYITAAIFLITHVVLFAFVFMYRYKRNRKAYFFSHSNTLEIIWTTIPAIAMAYLVYTGIIAWNETFTKDNSFTEYFGGITQTRNRLLWRLQGINSVGKYAIRG